MEAPLLATVIIGAICVSKIWKKLGVHFDKKLIQDKREQIANQQKGKKDNSNQEDCKYIDVIKDCNAFINCDDCICKKCDIECYQCEIRSKNLGY